jgi:glycosyltransferase involved in cell wall biosynthesis
MPQPPLVSIVLATYNRSRVLAHAIASVQRSSVTDWELIVVGDHCTDDSQAVVAAIGDPRITWINLAENAGEQSAPNNEGIRRARGRYLAFLNHDDLYFPDHLATSIACCEATGADLVWSPLLVALPASEDDLRSGREQFRLSGVTAGEDYDPRVFVFASSWVMRRELAARVGPWRPGRETFVTASQNWIFRAWRSGARLRCHAHVGVLAVPASFRPGSYRAADSPEHDHFARRMQDPLFRTMALERAAIAGERETNRFRFGRAPGAALLGLVFRPIAAAALAFGVHPYAPLLALRHGRRGNLVDALRRRTGLDRLRR